MAQHRGTTEILPTDGSGAQRAPLQFLIDANLGLKVDEEPLASALRACGVTATFSTDLPQIDREVADHKPDIAHIPIGDFLRLLGKGDHHYRGLAQATSKFTGQVRQRSLLVVRKDDPARSLLDLEGSKYAIINRSCSSTYFPPAIILGKHGKRIDDVLQVTPVKPGPTWQGLVDAVISGEVRATMVLEDVWKSEPKNEKETKIIDEYTGGLPGVVVVRNGLDEAVCKALTDALLGWVPARDAVYGRFKPFDDTEVHSFFHDINGLPDGE
jgi:ABC-type phosphate/phosphonate transport system substrate-binding protein